MSSIRFGLPFATPLEQTILPFITQSGNVPGFIPITKQEFSEPHTQVLTPYGSLLATSVTLPSQGTDGSGLRIEQYAALFVPQVQESLAPWLGYPDFVPNSSGFYSWYSMPTLGMVHHFGRGLLLEALYTGLDTTVPPAIPVGQPPEDPSKVPVVWAATVNKDALQNIAFFDFNWVSLLKAKLPVEEVPKWSAPKLQVQSNPVGGVFKSALVQGQPSDPQGLFDVVRVIKLNEPRQQVYEFVFSAFDAVSHATKICHFNLTVI